MVTCANDLHSETIEKSARLIHDFTARSQMTPAELGAVARPILENLEIEWLAPLLTNQYPQPQSQRAVAQYSQVFRQRLEGALRDAEIGFIEGKNMLEQPQKRYRPMHCGSCRQSRKQREVYRGQ
jgi:hypothetical protein